MADSPDFQNSKTVALQNEKGSRHGIFFLVSESNLIIATIYLTVRHIFEPTWLNDRDQFLYPNDGWKDDTEFQNDCLAFAIFHGQNRISSGKGLNYWIPFTENEVDSREKLVEENFNSPE